MRSTALIVLVLAGAASAQESPPPSLVASAFACSRTTLLQAQQCTVEGKTAPSAKSGEQAKENQRAAKIFAEDVCRSLSRADEVDDDAGLLSVCNARAAVAVKRCGGDGTRRMLDDAGRFNPGHARCYGALAALVTEIEALADTSSTCCACVADRCGQNASQCVEKLGAGKALEGTCASSTCSAECAALRLVAPRKP